MSKKSAKASLSITKVGLMILMGALPVLLVAATISSAILKKQNEINPKDFSINITNKYYSLPLGKTFTYETKTPEGMERDVVTTTGETKTIMGVTTLVVYDKVYLNGTLIEDTRDFLAQHKNGDLWYFGEEVDNYDKNGRFLSHEGAWQAGEKGGVAGIWVKQNPTVGETYRQEFLKGEAEDMVSTTSLDETVTIRGKTYTNCMKTHEWTPLNPAALEDKIYCPEVNTVVLEQDLADGERTELVSIK